LRPVRDKGDKPRSKTVQHYLRAIKQFTRWLHADGRLPMDPLVHLAGVQSLRPIGAVNGDRSIPGNCSG
jgi:hypothetical protein